MDEIVFERVTEFSPELASAVRTLLDQLDPDHQELTDDDIRGMLSSNGTHFIIGKEKTTQRIVAMATLIVYRIPFKMKAQAEDIVVDQSMRGKGIGTKLLQFVIEEAKNAGVKSLNLTSRPTRESANQLYLKVGFQKRDTNVYRMDL